MARQYNNDQLSGYVDQIFQRLERIEKQLGVLSEKAGVPFEDPRAQVPEDVLEMVRSGDRMGAMRRYRELTGADAEQAKATIAGL